MRKTLHPPGLVTRMAALYQVSWLTAWHWLNRERGLCANGCRTSETYLCHVCAKRHAQYQRKKRRQTDEPLLGEGGSRMVCAGEIR